MSSYAKITKHPTTGEYHLARWIDDYFAPHYYGVKFPSGDDQAVITFLNQIQKEYKERWRKDPLTGGGATELSVVVQRLEMPCEHVVQRGECIICRLAIEEED